MATKTRERTVKTYRVLRDGMRVGDSVRNFGDFMPEAEQMPTLRTLLNSNVIERVYVDQEEFEDWEKDQKKRDAKLAKGVVDEDSENEDGDSSEKAPKKKVAKRVAKKTVKKGKTSGGKQGKRLDGEAV